ncbi:MAG: lysylphosphatidylglycerol synthase transmembrane domain-containing protein [Candidatus Electrothrix aestuarii]|uniref:Lysylphosphatidylglycerol synthase transmembrane domain-containing protein n=1 Tax=Candidatus Electrothrix aestuarii TaxID=3062594 RepID=A0AAU8LUE9_9BACT|nr:lysylphosphatidylglycerol synthase transmembrane domain-containing protein [Candidatus Electrothrix aestuarii]
MSGKKKNLLLLTKIVFSTTLMYILYRRIPLEELKAVMSSLNYLYFLPIGLLLFVNTVLSALKWRLFLSADGVDIPLSTLTMTYLIGSFYNLFLPSNIGGDSYRIYDIGQKSRENVRAAASVFADRFSGFLALVSLSLISSVLVAREFNNFFFFLAPLLIFLIMLVVLIALIKEKPVRALLSLTRLNRFPFLVKLTEKFFLSFQCYGADRKLLTQVMLISFVFQLSVIFIVQLLALSLHASVSFFYFSAFVPLITLMEALPISVFGLGLRDVGYVFFFGWVGMTDIQTRSLALLFLGTSLGYSLIGGLVYLFRLLTSRPTNPADAPTS